MKKVSLGICLASMLCACSHQEDSVPSASDMSAARAKLAFTCTHEADHLPPLDPTADLLFRYGRYLKTRTVRRTLKRLPVITALPQPMVTTKPTIIFRAYSRMV